MPATLTVVDGMLLSATSPAFGKPDGDFQRAFLKARFEPFDQGMTMPEFAQAFAPRLVGPHPRDGAVEEIRSVLSTVSIEAYRLSMHTITTFDCRHNLPNIDIPTLLISGEHDTNSPISHDGKKWLVRSTVRNLSNCR